MNKFRSIGYYITILSGLVLIAGVFFNLNKKVKNWSTFSFVLMVICAIGYLLFLFSAIRDKDKANLKLMIIFGLLIFLSGVILTLVLNG